MQLYIGTYKRFVAVMAVLAAFSHPPKCLTLMFQVYFWWETLGHVNNVRGSAGKPGFVFVYALCVQHYIETHCPDRM